MKLCIHLLLIVIGALAGTGRASSTPAIVVSVPDQRLVLLDRGVPVAQFPVSTSKYGLGDQSGSYRTPLGSLEVAARIGQAAPVGAVFKNRVRTGEILRPNSKGRDPIVTRILWLRGRESRNAGAYSRGIYIHGTPVENKIGRPASYGCIRMRSRDIVKLFNAVPTGTRVEIVNAPISRVLRQTASIGGLPATN